MLNISVRLVRLKAWTKVAMSLLALGLALSPATARQETTKSVVDKGSNGLLETTTVKRDGVVIYQLQRMDRGRVGKYESYAERFYKGSLAMIEFSLVDGTRNCLVQSVQGVEVNIFSKSDSWKPSLILIDVPNAGFEYFSLQSDGFYKPIDEPNRSRFYKKWKDRPKLIPIPQESK